MTVLIPCGIDSICDLKSVLVVMDALRSVDSSPSFSSAWITMHAKKARYCISVGLSVPIRMLWSKSHRYDVIAVRSILIVQSRPLHEEM